MNDRKKFEEWLKEDTTIELNDELTDFAWYVWKAATAESAARIRDWAGLTDDEIRNIYYSLEKITDYKDAVLIIEAKLKEKNT